jgi:hypothetical protein
VVAATEAMEGRVARIRQVVLTAWDLDTAVTRIGTIFKTASVHTDPALLPELKNAMLPIGDCFWEVVSPVVEGTTAGRYLDRYGKGFAAKGASGYMLEIQVSPPSARLSGDTRGL